MQDDGNNLDTTDDKLLRVLADNARMSATDLGARVGLSGSAVRRRLKRLEKEHILKYTIVRRHRQAFAEAYVELDFVQRADVHAFLTKVVSLATVREASQIAGRPDALLRIRAESNDDIGALVNELRDFPEVANTKTLTVMHRKRHVWGGRRAI